MGGRGMGKSGSGMGNLEGSFKQGNSPSGSVRRGEVLLPAESLLASQIDFCLLE